MILLRFSLLEIFRKNIIVRRKKNLNAALLQREKELNQNRNILRIDICFRFIPEEHCTFFQCAVFD